MNIVKHRANEQRVRFGQSVRCAKTQRRGMLAGGGPINALVRLPNGRKMFVRWENIRPGNSRQLERGDRGRDNRT